MLLLRPHHINCIFFYTGLGYSKDFIEGMNNTLIFLKKNPTTKLKLVIQCDNLCTNCPHKQLNNTCLSKEKVAFLDYKTLKIYNLNENHEYEFKEIIDTIYKYFNKNKFHNICNSCGWYNQGICNENIIANQLKRWTL